MKNFEHNTFHPYPAYSNHSYNNNTNSNCHTHSPPTPPLLQQQLRPQLLLPPPTFNNNQQQAHPAVQVQQQQTLPPTQSQQQQTLPTTQAQQQRLQLAATPQSGPLQHLQQQMQSPQQQLATSTTTNSILYTFNHNNNNNSNHALNMQASTYANILANYNQSNMQNNNHHNINNNNNNNHNKNPNYHQHHHQQHAVYHHAVNQQSNVNPPQQDVAAAAGDKFTMDACEIANFLANELFMQQLVSVDGIQSGVPTLTTSTLTPTTLRSIEETFTQLINEPINAPYQAGFIPPPLAPFPSLATSSSAAAAAAAAVATTNTNYSSSLLDFTENYDTESEDSQGSWNVANLNEENSMATTDTSSAATDSTSFQNGLNGMGNNSLATSTTSSTNDFTSVNIAIAAAAAAAAAAKNGGITSTPNNKHTSNSATTTGRRNQGGRRPAKSANMSPEEEEKRRIRRERNKLAAARCRKRRVDQTNELLEEVAILEKKREGLQKDIESLNTTKQELEYILEAHRPTCQKVRQDMLSVNTFGGLIAPTSSSGNGGNGSGNNITGMDATLAATARSISPIDLKPVLLPENIIDVHIKHEPIDDGALDSGSSLDQDGPPSPKRILLTRHNPMIPPPLPNVATLSPALAAASASLNTPIVTTAPVSFCSFNHNSNTTLNALNAMVRPQHPNGSKQRPNTLPTMPRNLAQSLGLNVDGKPPTDINGVAIQTPSTGMFNFDSLMDGGTGLTPVSGPLVPTCSSQNKHPLELATPTSEPSKLVSL